jgi:hypothetical protein
MAMRIRGAFPAAGSERRSPIGLMLEMIALHRQIAVLQRNITRRPCFRSSDRLLWIFLSRWWLGWRESLMIVQPETVLRWDRAPWGGVGAVSLSSVGCAFRLPRAAAA